jgi:L-methionine (R)-S-oxide reductase
MVDQANTLTSVQVHADSSNFAEGMSKSEVFAQVLEQARALFEGQANWVST